MAGVGLAVAGVGLAVAGVGLAVAGVGLAVAGVGLAVAGVGLAVVVRAPAGVALLAGGTVGAAVSTAPALSGGEAVPALLQAARAALRSNATIRRAALRRRTGRPLRAWSLLTGPRHEVRHAPGTRCQSVRGVSHSARPRALPITISFSIVLWRLRPEFAVLAMAGGQDRTASAAFRTEPVW